MMPFKANADLFVEVNGGELEPIEDVYRPEGVLIVQAELRKAREVRALAMELFTELAAADAVHSRIVSPGSPVAPCDHVTDLLDRAQDMLYPGTREEGVELGPTPPVLGAVAPGMYLASNSGSTPYQNQQATASLEEGQEAAP